MPESVGQSTPTLTTHKKSLKQGPHVLTGLNPNSEWSGGGWLARQVIAGHASTPYTNRGLKSARTVKLL